MNLPIYSRLSSSIRPRPKPDPNQTQTSPSADHFSVLHGDKLHTMCEKWSVKYILWIREVLGHCMDAKISPKAPSEKATVSEIDTPLWRLMYFGRPFCRFSSANRKQWVGIILGTPGITYLCYSLAVSLNLYTVLPPRLSVQIYLSSDDR